MQFDLQKPYPRFIRTSLITFLLLCVLGLALLMISLGLLFQLGAQLAPWLLDGGWRLLLVTGSLFICFRVGIIVVRSARNLHHRLIKHTNYRLLLETIRVTLLSLLKHMLWILIQ